MSAHDLRAICEAFQVGGDYISCQPFGSGHINDTFQVVVENTVGPAKFTFQRINHNIFTDVAGLMDNFRRVTTHLHGKLSAMPGRDPDRETLSLVPTHDGSAYHVDANGNYWRAYVFVDGARTFDEVRDGAHAFEAARTFGEFQKLLMDMPEPPLVETIPDFHHTPKRFAKLVAAIEADVAGRGALAQPEIDFALARGDSTNTVVDMLASGELPWRVTHNDTKINNVLIDNADSRGLCVIDLDTVMPGSVLYDFGDQVRTTTGTAAEDEEDLAKVTFQLDMFEQLVNGYLSVGRDFLTANEIGLLAFAGRLITFEIGIRFLTDFLEGDVYFKVHKDNHNLYRARTQFEMVRQMEQQAERMEAIVARAARS
jgi:Ser/Thr protein kinase RdoA (MazF antagonist)